MAFLGAKGPTSQDAGRRALKLQKEDEEMVKEEEEKAWLECRNCQAPTVFSSEELLKKHTLSEHFLQVSFQTKLSLGPNSQCCGSGSEIREPVPF
jgi:hypothetical protein